MQLSRKIFKYIASLRAYNDIHIKKTDKSSAIVTSGKTDYLNKINDLLSDNDT